MDLTAKTDLEIMTMYAEMKAAQEQLAQQLAIVQAEFLRRVKEAKKDA
jgi:ribosomal protein L29